MSSDDICLVTAQSKTMCAIDIVATIGTTQQKYASHIASVARYQMPGAVISANLLHFPRFDSALSFLTSVNLYVHFTPAQCTLVDSSCHRCTSEFALAQVVPQNSVPLNMVAER